MTTVWELEVYKKGGMIWTEIFDSHPTPNRIRHFLNWLSMCELEETDKIVESIDEYNRSEEFGGISVTVNERIVKNGHL